VFPWAYDRTRLSSRKVQVFDLIRYQGPMGSDNMCHSQPQPSPKKTSETCLHQKAEQETAFNRDNIVRDFEASAVETPILQMTAKPRRLTRIVRFSRA